MTNNQKNTLVGAGQMGAAKSRNLIAAGPDLTDWTRDISHSAPLVVHGAKLAINPADAASGAEFSMTLWSDDIAIVPLIDGAAMQNTHAPGAIWSEHYIVQKDRGGQTHSVLDPEQQAHNGMIQ
jgi:3-hydroxyisobutyrate dehydrogenase-like beta-hydroxyacid dehydrogenase